MRELQDPRAFSPNTACSTPTLTPSCAQHGVLFLEAIFRQPAGERVRVRAEEHAFVTEDSKSCVQRIR